MKFRKSSTLLAMLSLLITVLILAACGDATSTTAPAATTSAATTTAAPATAIATPTTTAAPATTATPAPTTAAVGKKAELAAKATPENIATKLYTELKDGNMKKEMAVAFSKDLRASLKGTANGAGIYSLVGIKADQKIDSIDVGKATVNGTNATLSVTLKMADGSTVTNNLTMTKAEVKGQKGNETELWQVAKIEIN